MSWMHCLLVVASLAGDPSVATTESERYLADNPESDAVFGRTVAYDGTSLVVGAPRSGLGVPLSGQTYVFDIGEDGIAQAPQRLVSSDMTSNDEFGSVVTVDGDRLASSALGRDDAGPASGAVYIFERSGGGPNPWVEVQKVLGSNIEDFSSFGGSLDLEGALLMVGARGAPNDLGDPAGQVYVFGRQLDGIWTEIQRIEAPEPRSRFGWALDLEGNSLAVSGTGVSGDGTEVDEVYLFERATEGAGWSFVRSIAAPPGASIFGQALALEGTRLAIGGFDDSLGSNGGGSVWIHERNQGGPDAWGLVARARPQTLDSGDHFATALALEGDNLVVGARNGDGLFTDSGLAYRFRPGAAGQDWIEQERYVVTDATSGSLLGHALAIRDSDLFVGAHRHDVSPFTDSGGVFAYPLPLFTDGFESGDTLRWSTTVGDP